MIDIKDGSQANGARAQLWLRNGNLQQAWAVLWDGTYYGYDYFHLINKNSFKCLDMAADGAIGDGTRVQQWDCNGGANQHWIAKPVVNGNKWVTLRSLQNPNLCLDLSNFNYSNGALLWVWTCTDDWNQRWNIYP
ncbi:RICIN domain-containing protein [Microbispora corallina]|uniref:RICIN domain-containing protein n=1 Tax=Microbispora corallina TaxID=83302 RepID=UPI001950E381|nr:RICIN domain-containing protein [Microbispora corallina]